MSSRESFDVTYRSALDALAGEFESVDSSLAVDFPLSDPLRRQITSFVKRGGKRFRPALSLIVARSLGHTIVRPHIALELFHKFLLVHDDIIDEDTVRYGAPTLHAAMAKGMQQHYGEAMGIIGGDLLASASYQIILDSPIADERKVALLQLLTAATEEVAWGWYDQFLMDSLSLDDPALTFDRVEQSIIWVTGKYSIKLPLLFGYTLANKQPPEHLESLADTLGALYQTGDDIIGLFGDESKTGKSNNADITQGKKTLPLIISYQNASHRDKTILMRSIGNKHATRTDFERVRRIITKNGLQQTNHYMDIQRQRALELIDTIDIPSQLRTFLKGFVEHITHRDR
jgi:geranylgeranyl diphosphate synthase type I